MRFAHTRFLLTLTLIGLSSAAQAQYGFTRIVDTTTATPDGFGTFTGFSVPALSGGNLTFEGKGTTTAQTGIFAYLNGALTTIADTNTPLPGGTVNFLDFSSTVPAISGSNIAFAAPGSSGQRGVYSYINGTLGRVADTNTPIPNGGGSNFSTFGTAAISGSSVAFRGVSAPGIYSTISGTLDVVADSNTPIPGTTNKFFTNFLTNPAISGSNVLFTGSTTGVATGLYLSKSGAISTVVNGSTAVPNGSGVFSNEGSFSLSGTNIAFYGVSSIGAKAGIYASLNNSLLRIADTTVASPAGGLFTSFGAPLVSGNDIAFTGNYAGGHSGLFLYDNGTLTQIIGDGSALDGGVVSSIALGGFDGTSLSFLANFKDGRKGLYFAQAPTAVPEPGSIALAFAALTACGIGRRIRRRK